MAAQALAAVRELVGLLPGSNRGPPPRAPSADPADRSCPFLDRVVPASDIEVRERGGGGRKPSRLSYYYLNPTQRAQGNA